MSLHIPVLQRGANCLRPGHSSVPTEVQAGLPPLPCRGCGPAHPALDLQGGYQKCPMEPRWATTLGCGHGDPAISSIMPSPWPQHLGLIQGLNLRLAVLGDLLIPGTDLGNDVIEVQAAVVVHGQHHGRVACLGLQLAQLLQGGLTQWPPAAGSLSPGTPCGGGCLNFCPHSVNWPSLFTLGGIAYGLTSVGLSLPS